MAKKKPDDAAENDLSKSSQSGPVQDLSLIKEIEKIYGKKVISGGDLLLTEKRMVIPFGPALDIGLSGGVPEGIWGIVCGPPKYGKTTSLLSFAANCQKPEYGNRNVYYLSVEGRLEDRNLQIDGLITTAPRFNLIRSTKDHILTAEEFLAIAELALRGDPGCLVIIDSYASLLTNAESQKESAAGNIRSDAPKLLSNFCKRMSQIVPLNKCIVMGVTKRMANTSGFGNPFSEVGGNAVQYQESLKIVLKKRDIFVNSKGKVVGQKVLWKIENSALGPPNSEVESIIKYGKGIYKAAEIGVLAEQLKLTEKNGSWYEIEGYGKVQGEAGYFSLIEENPELEAALYKQILELMNDKKD
jgi:RecA/RadA recombinase